MVKRNLPPQAELWGRDVDSRLGNLEIARKNLETNISTGNARLAALLAQSNAINTQGSALDYAQAVIDDHQSTLLSQQALLVSLQSLIDAMNLTMAEQQTIIEDQRTFLEALSGEAGVEVETSGPVVGASSVSSTHTFTDSAAVSFVEPFDVLKDVSMNVSTLDSGVVAVCASWDVTLAATNATLTAALQLEVWDAEDVLVSTTPLTRALANCIETESGPTYVLTLTPQNEYLFKLRRSYAVDPIGGTNSGSVVWSYVSLVATPVEALELPDIAEVVNLIPNPWPHAWTGETDPGYESWIPLADVGWSCTLDSDHYYAQNGYGPTVGEGEYTVETDHHNATASPEAISYRIYSRPTGTGATPVVALSNYDVSFAIKVDRYGAYNGAVGVVWYDATGTELSTDTGDTVNLSTQYFASYFYGGVDRGSDWALGGYVTATLTAPSGAAFARPFAEVSGNVNPYRYHTGNISSSVFQLGTLE